MINRIKCIKDQQCLTVFEGELLSGIFVKHEREDLLPEVLFAVPSVFTAIDEDVELSAIKCKQTADKVLLDCTLNGRANHNRRPRHSLPLIF